MFDYRENRYNERQQADKHQHPVAQIVYVHQGCGIVGDGIGDYVLGSGEFLWIPANFPHDFIALQHSEISLLYLENHQFNFPENVTRFNAPVILSALLRRYSVLKKSDTITAYQVVITDQLLQAKQVHDSKPSHIDSRLIPILEAVYANPSIQHTLLSLSRQFGPSERTLQRLFEQSFGCTFRQWRQQLVMSKAQQMINEGKSMTFVALELGYQSLSAFSHAYGLATRA